VAAVGMGLPHVLYALTGNAWFFIVGTALSGLFFATLFLAFAYISDCVPAEKRAASIGLTMAMFGLAIAVAPMVGSLLADVTGVRMVFILSSCLTGLAVFYGLFFLPESLPESLPDADPRIDGLNVLNDTDWNPNTVKATDWSKATHVKEIKF